MNERFWQCNLQENGINLLYMMTEPANNNQTVDSISHVGFIIQDAFEVDFDSICGSSEEVQERRKSIKLLGFFNILITLLRFKIRLQQKLKKTTKMRNNVTNVVEFENGVSEESLEKMQNLHADFNGTIMQFQWMKFLAGKNTIRCQIYMLCGVMMYLLVMM
ncbi:hypothetical protein Hdeb2414_s0001g00000551 [Helianthus debilis subsp. tardiflorus]